MYKRAFRRLCGRPLVRRALQPVGLLAVSSTSVASALRRVTLEQAVYPVVFALHFRRPFFRVYVVVY